MHLELIRPQEQLTEKVGWCDGSWADLDEKRRSTTCGSLMLGAACELLLAFFLRELGYTMTACLRYDAWHGNAFGT